MSDDMWRTPRARRSDPCRGVRRPAVPRRRRGRRPPTTARTTPVSAGCASAPTTPGRCRTGPSPPTGEVPRIAAPTPPATTPTDDVDVWSSFTTESPVWRDDVGRRPDRRSDRRRRPRPDRRGARRQPVRADRRGRRTGEIPIDAAAPRAGPDHDRHRSVRRAPPSAGRARSRGARRPRRRSGRPAGPARTSRRSRPRPTATCRRPSASASCSPALFIVATLWRPVGVLALIVVVLGRRRRSSTSTRSPRRATARRSSLGLAACVAAPLAAYWVGDGALPLVIAFAFIAGAVGVHRRAERRVRPDAEHGDHDARRRVDRRARLVRRADPALVERSVGDHIGTDTLFLDRRSASWPTTSARCFVGSASAARRCARGSARTRRSRA